ncbi:MAG: hypothetical protein HY393_02685 [Candidatus Diapherotrites archaeon]|nr:hypothetical protein [Candidatus Diapherotrites archaeon]
MPRKKERSFRTYWAHPTFKGSKPARRLTAVHFLRDYLEARRMLSEAHESLRGARGDPDTIREAKQNQQEALQRMQRAETFFSQQAVIDRYHAHVFSPHELGDLARMQGVLTMLCKLQKPNSKLNRLVIQRTKTYKAFGIPETYIPMFLLAEARQKGILKK